MLIFDKCPQEKIIQKPKTNWKPASFMQLDSNMSYLRFLIYKLFMIKICVFNIFQSNRPFRSKKTYKSFYSTDI